MLKFAGYLFSNDVIGAMEKYTSELVQSVMKRAEAVYRNFRTEVNPLFSTLLIPHLTFEIGVVECLEMRFFADEY